MREITLLSDEIYQDDCLLAVVKPGGLLSVPGKGPDKQDCLITRLQTQFPEALVVHRLDQATSGIMIFALTREAQAALGRQFEERHIRKEYEALLEGEIAQEGKILLRQRLDVDNRPYQIVDDKGKEGVTEWRLLALIETKKGRLSRVRFLPLTGRTHQLRLHARELGVPIQGDTLYGRGIGGTERMMLHSCRLELTHPLTGEEFAFISPAPF